MSGKPENLVMRWREALSLRETVPGFLFLSVPARVLCLSLFLPGLSMTPMNFFFFFFLFVILRENSVQFKFYDYSGIRFRVVGLAGGPETIVTSDFTFCTFVFRAVRNCSGDVTF